MLASGRIDYERVIPNHLIKYATLIKDQPIVPYLSCYSEIIMCNRQNQFVVGTIASDNFKDHSTIWYFDEKSITSIEPKPIANMHVLKQLTTGSFLRKHDDKMLIGFENGELCLIELARCYNETTKYQSFHMLNCEIEHFSSISGISQWRDGHNFLTASAESVQVWTIDSDQDFRIKKNYPFSTKSMANDYYEITCVDTHNFDVNLFAVTDTQRICNLYDIRQEDYALNLYEQEFSNFGHCSFHTLDQNKLLLGANTGDIYMIDVRRPNEFLTKSSATDYCPIRLMKMNDEGYLATASTDNNIVIYDTNTDYLSIVYEKSEQKEVRDFCWNGSVLYSCYWHSPVSKHVFQS